MNLQFTFHKVSFRVFKIISLVLIIAFPTVIKAQNDTIHYEVNMLGITSASTYAPFWLQSNQYGKISASPNSANLSMGIEKDYGLNKSLFHYGFKGNAILQTDRNKSTVYFHELYAKARFSVLDFIVGAREEHLGNQDSTLSSGGLLFSHNARPMPKVTIGLEHFTPVPFTRGYIEIKGALSHGWFTDNTYSTGVLLHHKYIYGKIGGRLPVHLQYGLDHVAQWGGAAGTYPNLKPQPESLSDYKSIFLGRAGGSTANIGDQINALGNHIISQSMRLDVDITTFRIGAYWQNINEDGPIRRLWNSMNVSDGLWGISIRNTNFPYIKGVVYEYLNTTDQSGPYHDKDGIIYGGADSYFNNGTYQSGWSYYSRSIGTPFISSPQYNKDGGVYFENNRVQAHHIGMEGNIADYNYTILTSLSKNYGTYGVPYIEMIRNTSLMLAINKRFSTFHDIEFGCSIGTDFGKLYGGNSMGCLFSIRKSGDLFHY